MKERVVRRLLAEADVEVNGDRPWDIQVKDERLYDRVCREKTLGFGEAYMDGWWDCEAIDELITHLLLSRADVGVGRNLRHALRTVAWWLWNMQSRRRGHMIAERHYDLGNDLFQTFLDPFMQYSCAYFADTDDLEQAQKNKLDMICRKLQLGAGDHLLDIGCGWGGLALYAAREYGCRVTANNISEAQLRFARELCADQPVEFAQCDYRELGGTYSKIVSVGMFEHVGCRNYRAFFEVAARCLERDGVFLLHTIGGNTSSRSQHEPWIEKYIFPNGMLPSIAQIARASEGLFVVEDLHNIGPHYDRTLMTWNRNFQQAWPTLNGTKYDARFRRMWEYYLLSCAGTFRSRHTQVWQIVMTRAGTGTPQPSHCR
jgi:cyclopropane-fatty-acyl-phospholipid synthase